MERAPRNQQGFFQVEILVGISLLLLVMAMAASYYRYNLKATKRSDDFYVSTRLAAAALEEAKGDLSNRDTLAALLARIADTSHTRISRVTRQGKEFSVKVRFDPVGAGANLLRIKATVNWGGARGNSLGTLHPYVP